MKHRYFKRHKDLIKYAVRRVFSKQANERKEAETRMLKAGDFLQQCAAKLRRTR